MGFFGSSQKDIEKAYSEGIKDAKNTGIFGSIAHDMGTFVAEPFMDEEAKAREQGYQDYIHGNAPDQADK